MDIIIGEPHEIIITRTESNFDRACDSAYYQAVFHFGINEDGHSTKLSKWERSDSSICVKFISYQRVGNTHIYKFETTAHKETDDE